MDGDPASLGIFRIKGKCAKYLEILVIPVPSGARTLLHQHLLAGGPGTTRRGRALDVGAAGHHDSLGCVVIAPRDDSFKCKAAGQSNLLPIIFYFQVLK